MVADACVACCAWNAASFWGRSIVTAVKQVPGTLHLQVGGWGGRRRARRLWGRGGAAIDSRGAATAQPVQPQQSGCHAQQQPRPAHERLPRAGSLTWRSAWWGGARPPWQSGRSSRRTATSAWWPATQVGGRASSIGMVASAWLGEGSSIAGELSRPDSATARCSPVPPSLPAHWRSSPPLVPPHRRAPRTRAAAALQCSCSTCSGRPAAMVGRGECGVCVCWGRARE